MIPFTLIPLVPLLGQGNYHHMGRRFRQGGAGVDSADFLLMVAVLVAIAIVLVLVARFFANRHERGFSSQRALFSELCRAHGLNWTGRRLMRQLANYHGVSPCQLFVEPTRFAPEHWQGELANYASEIATLRDSLFGDEDGAERVESRE